MEFLKVYGPEDLESFPAGLWGIREPTGYWKDQKRMSGKCAVTLFLNRFANAQ